MVAPDQAAHEQVLRRRMSNTGASPIGIRRKAEKQDPLRDREAGGDRFWAWRLCHQTPAGFGITPLTARSLVLTLTFPQSETYLDPFGQALKEIREAQHPALGPRVLNLLCLGARLLCAIAPMFRSELAHLLPPAVPTFYYLTRIPNRRTL